MPTPTCSATAAGSSGWGEGCEGQAIDLSFSQVRKAARDTPNGNVRQKVWAEIQLLNEQQLEELYAVVRYFRLGATAAASQTQDEIRENRARVLSGIVARMQSVRLAEEAPASVVRRCMNAVDTNILLYVHDRRDATKQQRAVDLIGTLTDETVLLWQVACEYVNAGRKLQPFGLSPVAALQTVRDLQAVWPLTILTGEGLEKAVRLLDTHSLSFWDAMIIAACAEAGVTQSFSEDSTMYPQIEGVTLLNPFQ